MNKRTRIILLIVGIPVFTYMFLGELGVLKLYSNPSTANEPALKLNSKMLVSNLVKPRIGDFVCFKFKDEEFGSYIKVNRLCGLENDTLEIKNGIVYLNNINLDKDLTLIHNYKVSFNVFENLRKEGLINENSTSGIIGKESYFVSLNNSTAERYELIGNRIIEKQESESARKIFNQNWNKDNFGPIIIPKGKIFVLGDNRDNSNDSRYVGLIDKDKIIGVVVKKF